MFETFFTFIVFASLSLFPIFMIGEIIEEIADIRSGEYGASWFNVFELVHGLLMVVVISVPPAMLFFHTWF